MRFLGFRQTLKANQRNPDPGSLYKPGLFFMNAHDLAKLLLEQPNLPVQFLDHEGLITEVCGITEEDSCEFTQPVVKLLINHP